MNSKVNVNHLSDFLIQFLFLSISSNFWHYHHRLYIGNESSEKLTLPAKFSCIFLIHNIVLNYFKHAIMNLSYATGISNIPNYHTQWHEWRNQFQNLFNSKCVDLRININRFGDYWLSVLFWIIDRLIIFNTNDDHDSFGVNKCKTK